MEATAKIFFEKLTSLFQISLLIEAIDETRRTDVQRVEESKAWILPALNFLKSKYESSAMEKVKPLSVNEVKSLIAWDF